MRLIILKVRDNLINLSAQADTREYTHADKSFCFQSIYFSPEEGALPLHYAAQDRK